MGADRMTAADVREALLQRFPPTEYLSIYEAPQDSSRQGRKLDVVVVSLWRSRGLAVDGIEIKVSMSDWKRELDNPDKADWWHARVNRFWIAAPAEVAKKIRPQLPPNWGLLSCTPEGTRALVTPEPNREREPLGWPETVGLLRAAADCGVNVLHREHRRGFDEGYAAAKAEFEKRGIDAHMAHKLRDAEETVAALTERITAFKDATGIDLGTSRWGNHAARLGPLVAMVQAAMIQGPEILDRRLQSQADALRGIADSTEKIRAALASAFESEAPTLFEEAS